MLIYSCDGLKGLLEAIAEVWPQIKVQECAVHMVRSSLRYASRPRTSSRLAPDPVSRTGEPDQAAPPEAAQQLADQIEREPGARPDFRTYPAGHAFFNDENLHDTPDAAALRVRA